ncbi:hypothetical protein CapIbe_017127 [Capra ibex]
MSEEGTQEFWLPGLFFNHVPRDPGFQQRKESLQKLSLKAHCSTWSQGAWRLSAYPSPGRTILQPGLRESLRTHCVRNLSTPAEMALIKTIPLPLISQPGSRSTRTEEFPSPAGRG